MMKDNRPILPPSRRRRHQTSNSFTFNNQVYCNITFLIFRFPFSLHAYRKDPRVIKCHQLLDAFMERWTTKLPNHRPLPTAASNSSSIDLFCVFVSDHCISILILSCWYCWFLCWFLFWCCLAGTGFLCYADAPVNQYIFKRSECSTVRKSGLSIAYLGWG